MITGCREMLESSRAAQCPSVAYQLAGAKKVQQDLAGPGIVEHFVDGPQEAALIRACFAGGPAAFDSSIPNTTQLLPQDVLSEMELFEHMQELIAGLMAWPLQQFHCILKAIL